MSTTNLIALTHPIAATVIEANATDFVTDFDAVYQQVDDLLYQAKNSGRNCVVAAH